MKYFELLSIDKIYKIRVGVSAQDNWNIIDNSEENDIWFHVDDYPSCHVVLSIDDMNKPPKSVIKYCATLCKQGSKVKNSKNVKIIYTEIKNVQKDVTVGSVTTKKTKCLRI